MQSIPQQFSSSKAFAYVVSKGWIWREYADGVNVENCPYCSHGNYHFYMSCKDNFDGVFKCHRCGISGNLRTLMEKMGDRIPGVESRSDWANGSKVEELPDFEKAHEALLSNEAALSYLINSRGFSLEIIKQQKIGFTEKRYFRELGGEFPAIIFPYIINDSVSFAHYRTIPPSPKAFSSPTGRDSTLYNGGILKDGITNIILVEGETDTITLLGNGVTNVMGVPGAHFKKALWLDLLDQVNPEKIYILYDSDKVGQKAAQALASRIGIHRCWKIKLPEFSIEAEDGEVRAGKDINEWFTKGGGTLEKFQTLKDEAKLFDVQGAISSKDALDELEESLEGRESLEPTYNTPWESMNRLVGFEDGDVIDIVAAEKIGKSTFALNLIDYAVDKYGEDGIFICLEMTTSRMARKWVSMVCEIDDGTPKNKEEAVEKLKNLKNAIPKARQIASERKGDLYFCYPIISSIDDMYNLIHQCIRRYGVKWVIVDNLQLLADRTLKNQAHRTIHLSQISKTMAGIAKDTGIKFIRILQPHRIKEGNIASTDNVDGASQIEKDCDVGIALHRNKVADVNQKQFEEMGYLETEESFDSKMLVRIGLSRYSSGGIVTLSFDGAMSKVREYDPTRKKEMTTPKDDYVVKAETPPKEVIIEYIKNGSMGEKI
jgi:replicative DNA helicase